MGPFVHVHRENTTTLLPLPVKELGACTCSAQHEIRQRSRVHATCECSQDPSRKLLPWGKLTTSFHSATPTTETILHPRGIAEWPSLKLSPAQRASMNSARRKKSGFRQLPARPQYCCPFMHIYEARVSARIVLSDPYSPRGRCSSSRETTIKATEVPHLCHVSRSK